MCVWGGGHPKARDKGGGQGGVSLGAKVVSATASNSREA